MASELHDSWLELPDAAQYSHPTAILLSGYQEFGPVRPLRSWGPFVRVEELKPKIELTIDAVVQVVVEDSANVGGFLMAGMHFDPRSNTVRIESHIPVSIVLSVASLSLTAMISDETVVRRERWRWRPRLR